ncbi:hypothetical protein IIA29_07165 [candidate division KSB1 bacterium]|nr:hypothetical protein [candidate division KSB1 bacterium]
MFAQHRYSTGALRFAWLVTIIDIIDVIFLGGAITGDELFVFRRGASENCSYRIRAGNQNSIGRQAGLAESLPCRGFSRQRGARF